VLWNTSLPMGSINSMAIFHGDVIFILEPEIPNIAKLFINDIVVKGSATPYETPEGGYEMV
jgi:hypothetical protein